MKEVHIVLNQEDLDVLSKALVEMPFRLAAPLIGKIERQLAEQHTDKADSPAPSGASPNNL